MRLRPKSPNHFPAQEKAFTLLEVIIAMTLMGALMAVIWSLFGTFTRLEEKSSKSSTELQLVRAVSHQLRSDLEHAAVLPIEPNFVITEEGVEYQKETPPTEVEVTAVSAGPSTPDEDGQLNQPSPPSSEANVDASPLLHNRFEAQLPSETFLRGSATRLEFLTRLPSTYDVPVGQQQIGTETRYGTHQWVLYEWRDKRSLESLLRTDPVLNPRNTPTPALDPNRDPRLGPVPVHEIRPLNPNENVGLIRETKSWLHVVRDRQRHELWQQAQAAGMIIDGRLQLSTPTPSNVRPTEQMTPMGDNAEHENVIPWTPPPEFRHKKVHIPEVTRLQFRYFNGTSWALNWSSQIFPVAVEIAFDLDPEAPIERAEEFATAHARVLGGKAVSEVLTPQELEEEDASLLEVLDPPTNLSDPTAILTEYRFVIFVHPEREEGSNQLANPVSGIPTDPFDANLPPSETTDEAYGGR